MREVLLVKRRSWAAVARVALLLAAASAQTMEWDVANAAQHELRNADVRAAMVRPISKGRDHIFGNPNAEISLIEYSDFECPFCKRFHETAKQVVQAYGGKVNWVYRHFPLYFHNPAAQREGEAAECAAELGGNSAFWRYADFIYARTSLGGTGVPEEQLPEMAASIGLDKARFAEYLRSGRKTTRVNEDYVDGQAIGVRGTPGNVLRNNRTGAVILRIGAVPFGQIKAEIDWLLGQGGAAGALEGR